MSALNIGRHGADLTFFTAIFLLQVGSTAVLGGKYYMLFNGGHIYSSDNPIRGYKPEPKNFEFLSDGEHAAHGPH